MSAKPILVDHIQIDITKEDVLIKMGMPPDHRFGDAIAEVIEEAKTLANAKLLYCEGTIESRTADSLVINGIEFKGVDLVKALEGIDVCYPYIVTCGKELYDYALSCPDLVKMLYFDNIASFYLLQASMNLANIIDNQYHTLSKCMTPGSFEGFALDQNYPIFKVLDYGKGTDIDLNSSFIMNPAKSVAGIRFVPKDCKKECAICQKEDCDRRIAAFDKKVFEDTLC